MAEWLKAHAWKACVRESVPWVRIPLPPPRRLSPPSQSGNRGKICDVWHSGGLAPTADKVWQIRNDRLAGNAEAIAKLVPECEAEFGCGAHQSGECVAAVAAIGTASAATDLALGDMETDVALGAIGVERYLRSIESIISALSRYSSV